MAIRHFPLLAGSEICLAEKTDTKGMNARILKSIVQKHLIS
jgi:hypothetical protein